MSLLKTPLNVGRLTLKDRLVMPPMATPKAADDGLVTDELCRYYADKAQGGALGLVITEHAYVQTAGKAHRGQLSIAQDGVIPGLRRLTDAVHRTGTPVFAQISHAGGRTWADITGCEGVAPSAVAQPRAKAGAPVPRAMTAQELRALPDIFAAAARRARQAGYDGVEIHSAHGYLLNQFLSPLTNRRTDGYGGSLENRVRIHREILAAVRGAVGPEYPVAVRLAACDFLEGGVTVQDAVAACRLLEADGADLLDISGGMYGYLNPENSGEGYFAPLSAAVRQAVRVPVLVTGGVVTPQGAEALLQRGDADLVGVGRALLKNSAWAVEALAALPG